MSELNWRTADVTLNDGLIPDPNAEHVLLKNLTGVHVAVEGAFLHIDPQNGEPAYHGQSERHVHIIPASAVQKVSYRVTNLDPAPKVF
ncbi:hypothetical protein [Streptomyces sp. NPDC015130]|uniref:hypothetical protein n=1 Tax=Streptomyces sp. NPDC015130 TaxID=3364940 RepID=UPI0036F9656F